MHLPRFNTIFALTRCCTRFFIFGSALALIGSIVGATAHNVNTLIAAEVLIGVAVAFQQSFFWVVAEIVPMRWRYIVRPPAGHIIEASLNRFRPIRTVI